MDAVILSRFFMWCTILNAGLLALSFLVLAAGGDFVYKMHSRWFPMPREKFNASIYTMIGTYKIMVLVFNAVPWAVLAIIG